MKDLILFGRPLPDVPVTSTLPDWQQADPRWMADALQIALDRPGGGWFVVDERRRFGAADVPADCVPYTAEEVRRLRAGPLVGVAPVRRRLLDAIERQH